MRITQRAVALNSLQNLNRNLTNSARLQEQLTSGKLIKSPSDSPTGTNTSMQTRAAIRANEQYTRNINDGQGWLDQTDSALQSMTRMTQQVRDLTVQGMNTGALSGTAQTAISTEMKSLREALLGVANQQVQGRPMFGGITGGTVAYDSTGTWAGNESAPVTRRVSSSETVRIDITGVEAFGPPGEDLFAIVDKIANAVSSDPSALAGHLGELDVALDRMMNALTDVGSRQARVEQSALSAVDLGFSLKGTLSSAEDIDLPKTIMELQMQQMGYEAALSATAKALQPTLMDFLR